MTDPANVAQLLGIGILFMVVADAVVGLRLVRLARRTRQLPELCYGLSFLLLGVLGYPLSIVARRAAMAGAPVPALLPTALLFQDLASLAMYAATAATFRSTERWPRGLLWIAALVFAVSLLGDSASAGRWSFRDGGVWYQVGFFARASAFLWAAFEAGRHYRRLRRRARLGLADPVVTDRFRLWTLSSCAISAAFLVFYLARWTGDAVATSVPVLLATSLAGLVAGLTVWLAFVPPKAYLRRVRGRATRLAPAE